MRSVQQLALAARLARRELRGSARGFAVFLACLALGVAAIAAVGVINAGVVAGLKRDAAAMLGGDLKIEHANVPLTADELAPLVPDGASVAEIMRTNAMASSNGRRVVTELKAVGEAYPLYGEVELDPPMPLREALAGGGVVVEPGLLARLGLEVGDELRIGEAAFEIRAVLKREPDRFGGFVSIGPRSLISLADLERTKTILPGSLARYGYAVLLPEGIVPAAYAGELRSRHPEASWRVRSRGEAQPRLARFTERLASYLTIAGLTSLLIGGIGVALAVQNYLAGRITTIATLKCLGAPGGLVFKVYLAQVLALATLGVLIGLALGQAAPWLLHLLPQDALPVALIQGFYPKPLLLAAGCGYLAALAFTLWPLARARATSAAEIFRALVAPVHARVRRRDLLWLGACLLALATLALVSVGDRTLGLAFIGVAAVAALALAGLARLVLLAAGIGANHARAPLRLALANMRRPGSGTASVVMALGAGLAVLTMVALLRHNLLVELQDSFPERAPAFFFIDIQPDQLARFGELVGRVEGAQIIDTAPMVRGRVVRIAGRPVDQVAIDPEVRWTVRHDRGLTFSRELPPDTELVEGAWWPADYAGPPLVSVDAEVAQGYGVGVGDRLSFSVLGRVIEAEIASTRSITWQDGGMNWVFMLSPGTLEAAPHTWIATVESAPAQDARLIEVVSEELANVTPISVREITRQLAEAFGKIALAVAAVGAVTLASGVLVLAGAVAAARRRHLYEAVVLKVLGARRLDLLRVFALEYLGLGLAAALAGGILGTLSAYVVVVWVMELSWSFSFAAVLGLSLLALLVTLGAGFAGTWRLLGRPAAPVLRTA